MFKTFATQPRAWGGPGLMQVNAVRRKNAYPAKVPRKPTVLSFMTAAE